MDDLTELKAKASPKFEALAKEIRLLNNEQVITNNLLCQVIDLLMSLNKYQGDEKADKGWLEELYKTTKCEKQATKKHRSVGLKFAILVTVVALIGESISSGDSSIFVTLIKFAKGLVL